VNITLRIAVRDDARAALLRDAELARTIALSAPVLELDADDPRFDRVLELTNGSSGCWLNPIVTFTASEQRSARLFQLEGRKIVPETAADAELNRARLEAAPFHENGTGAVRIKLIDRIALSRIALPANGVALAGDWMAEFVAHRAAAAVFEQAGLTGCSFRPIFNPKTGRDHADFVQPYSESIMSPAALDATTISLAADLPEEGGWRELGCLSYAPEAVARAADFNRTAENWSNSFIPFWIVTAKVREIFQAHKLKGWAFRPVLELGTPLHRTYTEAWASLLQRVAINPKNRW
jgi:hypothetical protein